MGGGLECSRTTASCCSSRRYNARVAVVDAPGQTAIDLIVGLETFVPSADRAEVQKEVGKLKAYGRPGAGCSTTSTSSSRGIDAYYKATSADHQPWTRRDVIALNAVKSELFGEGGGAEVQAAQLSTAWSRISSARRHRSGTTCASARTRDSGVDPGQLPVCAPDRSGNVVIDNGSFQPIPGPSATAARRRGPKASCAARATC